LGHIEQSRQSIAALLNSFASLHYLITAAIKSVRTGNSEQPVFIDLEGYDGQPYKPSKSMRRTLTLAAGEMLLPVVFFHPGVYRLLPALLF
jgi:hypothetical protein